MSDSNRRLSDDPFIHHAFEHMRSVDSPLSDEQKTQRRHKMLMRASSADIDTLADTEPIKEQNLFLLTDRRGAVPAGVDDAFGLFHHDIRYLNRWELRLAGQPLVPLSSEAGDGFMSSFLLANPQVCLPGNKQLDQETVTITWIHTLDGDRATLHDELIIHNHGKEPLTLPVTLHFEATFDEILSIRGLLRAQFGKLTENGVWRDGSLVSTYHGGDGFNRRTSIRPSLDPTRAGDGRLEFDLQLAAHGSRTLEINIATREWRQDDDPDPGVAPDPIDIRRHRETRRREYDQWMNEHARLECDDFVVEKMVQRALRDLRLLRSHVEGRNYIAAGVPWFVNLFGRDSVLAALSTLAFSPAIATDTLPLMAELQGSRDLPWLSEQPGKLHHSLRLGELARAGQAPHTPFFGSTDTTPLFLILLERHAAWTGSLDMFTRLRSTVDAALAWLDGPADSDGDGYIDYESPVVDNSLINQGWKDSGNAIINPDGSVAEPPVAMVEFQAYLYRAWLSCADLFARSEDHDRASELRGKAGRLKQRFNRDFWMEDRRCFAMALQKGGRPVNVVSSNAGHALWGGICDTTHGPRTAERLLKPDMLSQWGVRTLSSDEPVYNPISYHLGSVWPHDNALFANGLRAHGYDDHALLVFNGIQHIARLKDDYRMPELVCGFSEKEFASPVPYPIACRPQGWGAGAVTYLLKTLLGLQPDGFEKRLRVVRPILPEAINRLTLYRVDVAGARTDLRFTRGDNGRTDLDVLQVEGELEVVLDREGRDGDNWI